MDPWMYMYKLKCISTLSPFVSLHLEVELYDFYCGLAVLSQLIKMQWKEIVDDELSLLSSNLDLAGEVEDHSGVVHGTPFDACLIASLPFLNHPFYLLL